MLGNMLDTNLCIRVLRDRPAGLRPRFNSEVETLCISTITLTELLHGAAKSVRPADNRHEVERMAERLTVLDFDSSAAEHAALYRSRCRAPAGQSGTPRRDNDTNAPTAATCLPCRARARRTPS